MPTPQDIRDRIADIDAILQSGVTSTTVDGETTAFDHASLRRERQTLQEQLGTKRKRRRVFNLNMGGR